MKSIRLTTNLTLTISLLLLLGACSESDQGSTTNNKDVTITSLVTGDSSTVKPGDKLTPEDDSTVIQVVNNIDSNKKTVVILEGKASISSIVAD